MPVVTCVQSVIAVQCSAYLTGLALPGPAPAPAPDVYVTQLNAGWTGVSPQYKLWLQPVCTVNRRETHNIMVWLNLSVCWHHVTGESFILAFLLSDPACLQAVMKNWTFRKIQELEIQMESRLNKLLLSKSTFYPEKNEKLPEVGMMPLPARYEKVDYCLV